MNAPALLDHSDDLGDGLWLIEASAGTGAVRTPAPRLRCRTTLQGRG